MATFSVWGLLFFFTNEEILNFYWRIPFIISGLFGLLLFRMRSFDSSKISEVRSSMENFNLKEYCLPILNSISVMIFPAFLS